MRYALQQHACPNPPCSKQSPNGLYMLVQAFINVATGGFGTELTVKTDEGLKDKLGGAAYFVTGTRWHGILWETAC